MSSLKLNFAYNTAYQILTILLPIITTPYISRVLGADGIGEFAYTYSISYYFYIFSKLGIDSHGNRSIAIDREDKTRLSETFWNIYAIQFFLSFIFLTTYIFITLFYTSSLKIIAWLQGIFLLSSFFDINWFFFGLEKFKITISRNILIKIVTVSLIFIFVNDASDVWIYTLILSIGSFFSQVYLWFSIRKYIQFSTPKIPIIKHHIKPIIVLFIPVLSFSIYKIMDKIMLGSMTNMVQVGLYDNAIKIITLPLGFITALGTIMLPRISHLVALGDKERIQHYLFFSFKLVTIMGSAIGFGLSGISDIFAPVFFGPEFIESGTMISYLGITVLFIAWANVIRMQYLIPYKKDRIYIISMIAGAFTNLIINIILIPGMHAFGAVLGTIAAEFTIMFIQIYLVRKEIDIKKSIYECVPFILFGIIMFLSLQIASANLSSNLINLISLVLIGATIFISLTLIRLFMKKDELYIFAKNWIHGLSDDRSR